MAGREPYNMWESLVRWGDIVMALKVEGKITPFEEDKLIISLADGVLASDDEYQEEAHHQRVNRMLKFKDEVDRFWVAVPPGREHKRRMI